MWLPLRSLALIRKLRLGITAEFLETMPELQRRTLQAHPVCPFEDTVRALLRALTERTVRTNHSVSPGAQ